MEDDNSFFGFLQDYHFAAAAADDLFAVLDGLDRITDVPPVTPLPPPTVLPPADDQKITNPTALVEADVQTSPKTKRRKLTTASVVPDHEGNPVVHGLQKISHITVERNRRKQMNEHLSVLRSLMPCFYVKRGDQASIIGGVVDYINELQQILQSLEAKKQRKAVYSEVILSPRLQVSSTPIMPPSTTLSPRKPPPPQPSSRINLAPISPRTPTPSSPYKPRQRPAGGCYGGQSPPAATSSSADNANELMANSKSAVAEVEVKSCGSNVVLKTLSPRIPGQAVRIIAALEELALEILHVNVSTVDEKLLNSFTIKIGIECQLSAEELANQVQQTFCHHAPL